MISPLWLSNHDYNQGGKLVFSINILKIEPIELWKNLQKVHEFQNFKQYARKAWIGSHYWLNGYLSCFFAINPELFQICLTL